MIVQNKLISSGIEFDRISNTCIALPNAAKIDEIIQLNNEAVVQDYNSQRVGGFMELANIEFIKQNPSKKIRVWDCCAASGGKSIMAKDILGDVELTVSDLRASIIINLKKNVLRCPVSGTMRIL